MQWTPCECGRPAVTAVTVHMYSSVGQPLTRTLHLCATCYIAHLESELYALHADAAIGRPLNDRRMTPR